MFNRKAPIKIKVTPNIAKQMNSNKKFNIGDGAAQLAASLAASRTASRGVGAAGLRGGPIGEKSPIFDGNSNAFFYNQHDKPQA